MSLEALCLPKDAHEFSQRHRLGTLLLLGPQTGYVTSLTSSTLNRSPVIKTPIALPLAVHIFHGKWLLYLLELVVVSFSDFKP